jgi:putative DNA methylase
VQELIAAPYRFGGDKERARRFFEEGLGKAFTHMRQSQHPEYPLTIFYAFKQAESDQSGDDEIGYALGVASTGWETMLEGLLKAGFMISGTWPSRTERDQGLKTGTNVLASSIVLVCRPRPENAPLTTRREFIVALKRDLPAALKKLQHGNIAPVDLAQSAIGPGIAVFSRYVKVLESDGTPMPVRTALALINQVLDEVLAEQEGEFDADTRWAIAWFEQFGFDEGPFGVAELLCTAKNTAVSGLAEAGILAAKAGKVRLLRRENLAADWDPTRDRRITVWEVTQHLIRTLEQQGETGAAALVQNVGGLGEVAHDLAYRLYGLCERKRWAQEALAYNSLVIAWPEIVRLAGQRSSQVQEDLF